MCSVVEYYRFLLFDLSGILIECSVNVFYSLIIINYGTTYKLEFWCHTTEYIQERSQPGNEVYAKCGKGPNWVLDKALVEYDVYALAYLRIGSYAPDINVLNFTLQFRPGFII